MSQDSFEPSRIEKVADPHIVQLTEVAKDIVESLKMIAVRLYELREAIESLKGY